MPAEVATLAVGLVLNTGKFFGALGMTLNSAASKMTMWGLRTTALVSAPFIALIGITGRFAVEFDQAMRNVNASLQLPEAQFAELRKDVIDLSMTSRSTAVDIAQSLLMVSQAGLESGEAWHLVEIATHAAGAAFSTTAQTARFLIATMRAYNLSLEDANSLMDQAIFASQKGAGSFDDIANAIGLVAPMAATAGIGFDELLGAMRTLRMGGLNASTAMVSLQGVIRKIIMPTEAMKAVFEATGYESGIAALEVLGLDGVIRLMTRAAGGSADKMAELFNDVRAARGAFILMKDDASGLTESINLLGDAASFEGAMERAREQQYKSLSSQTKRLKNTMMAFGLALWEIPMPALVKLVDLVRDVALSFMGLSDTTKQWIVIGIAAAAALGPLLLMLGKLLSIGSMIVSVALNPLILAFAALAFAAYKWITARYHIENLQDAVVAFADIAVQALDWVSERLVGMVDLIGQMAEWGAQAIGAFAQGIVSGLGLVVKAINYVVGGIAALLGPGSPPAAMPEIVQWGQNAIDQFLRGMTMGDFDILDDVGDKIADHLRTLDFGGEEALSEALIRARVALARVVAEASTGGEASVQAWQDLREAIHDDTGELERYLRLRIEAGRFEDGLAQAELARKKVSKQLEDEKYAIEIRHKQATHQLEEEGHAIELRHKEELRVVDEKVKTAEEALANFREQSAEIPERFTRGRRRQLEVELKAAQEERDSVKDRQEIERDEFETRKRRISELQKIERDEFEIRKRHVMEEVDAQVEAAQAKRNLAQEEADWLEAVIMQKQKIIDLYKKEKEGAEELGLDLSQLTPEALDIGDAIGGIKDQFDAAKEAASGLFGVWRAFWTGLKNVDASYAKQKLLMEGMTEEEREMFRTGQKVGGAWEDFTDVLDKIVEALDPLIQKLNELSGPEKFALGLAALFGPKLLLRLAPRLIGFGIGIGGFILKGIVAAISGAPGVLGGIAGGLAGIWEFLFAGAAGIGELTLALGVFAAIVAAVIATLRFLWLYGKEALWDLFEGAKGFVDEFFSSIDLDRWGPVIDGLTMLWNALKVVLKVVGGIIGTVLIAAFTALGAALPFLGSLLANLINLLGSLASLIMTNVIGPLDILWTLFTEGPREAWEKFLYYAEQGRVAVLEILESLAAMGVDILTGFSAMMIGIWAGAAEGVLGIIEDLFGSATTIFGVKLDEIRQGIRQFKDDAVGFFMNLHDEVLQWIRELVGGALGWFTTLQETLIGGSIIPDMIAQIEGAFGQMGQNVAGAGTQMMQGLTTGLTGGIPALAGALAGAGTPGAVAGGFAGQLTIINNWDASISARDRAELRAEMFDTTYRALGETYGG